MQQLKLRSYFDPEEEKCTSYSLLSAQPQDNSVVRENVQPAIRTAVFGFFA